MIGKRVRVKDSSVWDVQTWLGATGVVTRDRGRPGAYWVDIDGGSDEVWFFTDELVVLGGKHAGEPHPENFVDPPLNRIGCDHAIYEANMHGRYAGGTDWEAEIDAWLTERPYL